MTLLILACGGGPAVTAVPGQVETIIASTMQAIPVASPTALPPTSFPTIAPTNTFIPTFPAPANTSAPINPAPNGTQILFSPGATFGLVEGMINSGQTISYWLSAGKGQPMIVDLGSLNNDVTLSIVANDGSVLLPASQKGGNWQGLPRHRCVLFQRE